MKNNKFFLGFAFALLVFVCVAASVTTYDVLNVTDDPYAVGWNGSTAVPTKNSVYDELQNRATLTDLTSATNNLDAAKILFGTLPMDRQNGRVATNNNATLAGNALITGDAGRGVRSTNLTATVVGTSSGVPFGATSAQIGGLFSGGLTYLKADGTTGSGGSSTADFKQWTGVDSGHWWLWLAPANDPGSHRWLWAITNSSTGLPAMTMTVQEGSGGEDFGFEVYNLAGTQKTLSTVDGTLRTGGFKVVDWLNGTVNDPDDGNIVFDAKNQRIMDGVGGNIRLSFPNGSPISALALVETEYLRVQGAQTNYNDVLFTNNAAANKPYVIWLASPGYFEYTNPAVAKTFSILGNTITNSGGGIFTTNVSNADQTVKINSGTASTTGQTSYDSGYISTFDGLTIDIDDDANAANASLDVRNGTNAIVFRVEESGSVSAPSGASTTRNYFGGALKVDTTTTGNVGGGEDNLISYSIPAGALTVNGQSIEFDVWGSFAANVNTKELIVYFGATKVADSGAGGLILNGVAWRVHGKVVRTGATTQTATAELTVGGTLLSGVNGSIAFTTAPGETLSGAVTFKCTGTDSGGIPADNNIVQNGMHLKWNPTGN